MNNQNKVLIVGLFIATIIAAGIGALLTSFPKHYRLTKVGVEAQGTVIAKERENHQNILVEYKVGNRLFKTVGHAEDIGKIFATVQINETVSVFYDPTSPESATLGNPNKQLDSSYAGIVFVGLAPIIFFVSYEIKKRIKK